MDPQEWLPKWATRGDLAAAAVGYAAGFAVDVFYFPAGVPPGTTAGVFAVATVGLKNSAQAALEGFRRKKQAQDARLALEDRATVLHRLLVDEELEAPAGKLARDLDLWRKGVLDDNDLGQILDEVVGDYRRHVLAGSGSGRFQTLEVDEDVS